MTRLVVTIAVALSVAVAAPPSAQAANAMHATMVKVPALDGGKGVMRVIATWEKRGYMPWGLARKNGAWHLMMLKGFDGIHYASSRITTLPTNKPKQLSKKVDQLVAGGYLPVGMAKLRRNRLLVLAIKLKGIAASGMESLKLTSCRSATIQRCLKAKLSLINQNYIPTAVAEFGSQVVLMFVKSKQWSANITGYTLKVARPNPAAITGLLNAQIATKRMPVGVMFYSKTQAAALFVGLKR